MRPHLPRKHRIILSKIINSTKLDNDSKKQAWYTMVEAISSFDLRDTSSYDGNTIIDEVLAMGETELDEKKVVHDTEKLALQAFLMDTLWAKIKDDRGLLLFFLVDPKRDKLSLLQKACMQGNEHNLEILIAGLMKYVTPTQRDIAFNCLIQKNEAHFNLIHQITKQGSTKNLMLVLNALEFFLEDYKEKVLALMMEKNRAGFTVFLSALMQGDESNVEKLLEALMKWSNQDYYKLKKWLLTENKRNFTPLQQAIMGGNLHNLQTVLHLLELYFKEDKAGLKAQVMHVNRDGYNGLHHAATTGHLTIVKTFIDFIEKHFGNKVAGQHPSEAAIILQTLANQRSRTSFTPKAPPASYDCERINQKIESLRKYPRKILSQTTLFSSTKAISRSNLAANRLTNKAEDQVENKYNVSALLDQPRVGVKEQLKDTAIAHQECIRSPLEDNDWPELKSAVEEARQWNNTASQDWDSAYWSIDDGTAQAQIKSYGNMAYLKEKPSFFPSLESVEKVNKDIAGWVPTNATSVTPRLPFWAKEKDIWSEGGLRNTMGLNISPIRKTSANSQKSERSVPTKHLGPSSEGK